MNFSRVNENCYHFDHDCISTRFHEVVVIKAISLPLFDVLLVVRLLELFHLDGLKHEVSVLKFALLLLTDYISESISSERFCIHQIRIRPITFLPLMNTEAIALGRCGHCMFVDVVHRLIVI